MKKSNFLLSIKKASAIFYEDESLANHCSFKTGGNAKYYCEPKGVQQLAEIVRLCKENDLNFFVLGNGTNTIFHKFDGLVISTKQLRQICILEENLVMCEAGVGLFRLNMFLCECYLSGLEWSYGIPGSVGGATIMNAGAFGHELGELIEKVEVFDGRRFKTFKKNKLWFSYRKSFFTGQNFVVTRVYFRLKKQENNEKIKDEMFANFEKRKKHQPLDFPSAGSVFKRTENVIPALIIEKLGLKGFGVGGAEISTKHSGFIINKNQAKVEDIEGLIAIIREKALKEKGIDLEQEVIIVKE